MVKEGYQAIWERIWHKEELNVILQCDVKSIDRQPDKVLIDCDLNGQEKIMEFDYLITTGPLKTLLNILKKPTQKEIQIFSRLRKFVLCTTLYESDQQVHNTQVIEYRPGLMSQNFPGEVFAQRHSERCVIGKKDKYKKEKLTEKEKGDQSEKVAEKEKGVIKSGKLENEEKLEKDKDKSAEKVSETKKDENTPGKVEKKRHQKNGKTERKIVARQGTTGTKKIARFRKREIRKRPRGKKKNQIKKNKTKKNTSSKN